MKTIHLVAIVCLLVAAGCRADLGSSDYDSQEAFDFPDAVDTSVEPTTPTPLFGTSPFVRGDDRLAVLLYYETGRSEALVIDDNQTFLNVFEESLSIGQSTDRVEGLMSTALELTGSVGFWGTNFEFRQGSRAAPLRPVDFTFWEILHVALKSSDAAFADVSISIIGSGGEGVVLASDYGYTNNGEWFSMDIPLSDFAAAGADLSAVTNPLGFSGAGNTAGEVLLVDDVYFTTP